MGCKGNPVSAEDKKWEIEADARTLAEAQEIRADKKRDAAAWKELQNTAKTTQEAVDLEKKVKAGLDKTFSNPSKDE